MGFNDNNRGSNNRGGNSRGGSGGFNRGGNSRGGGGGFRSNNGPREMHKAICSDCKQETEVPFKPSGERPVYCRECFQNHRPPKRY
ncbi:MAG: CxxC-x17-CxxC domain-containing protein [Methanolobus sp.]